MDPHAWVMEIPGTELVEYGTDRPLGIGKKAKRLGRPEDRFAKTVAWYQRRRIESRLHGGYLSVVRGGQEVSRAKLYRCLQELFNGSVDTAGIRIAPRRRLPRGQRRGTVGPFLTDEDLDRLMYRCVIIDEDIDPDESLEFAHPSEPGIGLIVPVRSLRDALYDRFPRDEHPDFVVQRADIRDAPRFRSNI